jgi:hypothetical protein
MYMQVRDVQTVADVSIVEHFKDGFVGRFGHDMDCLNWAYFYLLRIHPPVVPQKLPKLIVEMSLAEVPSRLHAGEAAWSVLWPFPFHEYRSLDVVGKRALAAVHVEQACRWICRFNHWSEEPWLAIAKITTSPEYDWTIVGKRWHSGPGRKHKVAMSVAMHIDRFELGLVHAAVRLQQPPRTVFLRKMLGGAEVDSLLKIKPTWLTETVCEIAYEYFREKYRVDLVTGTVESIPAR